MISHRSFQRMPPSDPNSRDNKLLVILVIISICLIAFTCNLKAQTKANLFKQSELVGITGLSVVTGSGLQIGVSQPSAPLQVLRLNAGSTAFEWYIPPASSGGTVTQVNDGWGITGGPITTTGTLAGDSTEVTSVYANSLKVFISDTGAMLAYYLRSLDTLQLSNRINLKLNISDTAAMLSPYLRDLDTLSLSNRINLKVSISDTASMLSPYLRKLDTLSLSNRINLKLNIADTAGMLGNYLQTGIAASTYATISNLALKLNIADTAAMLSNYLQTGVAAAIYATLAGLNLKVNISDTASMLSNYLRTGVAASTYATISNLALKVNISDTASMLSPYLRTVDTIPMLANYLTESNTKTVINKSLSGSSNTFTNIPNSALTNSTISGVSLGGNLFSLTPGVGITGSAYNGSSAFTWNNDTVTVMASKNWVTNTIAALPGATPGGGDTEIQYNNTGAFAADASFTKTAAKVTLASDGSGFLGAFHITKGDAVNQYIVMEEDAGSPNTAYLTFKSSGGNAIAMGATFNAGAPESYVFTDPSAVTLASIDVTSGDLLVANLAGASTRMVTADASGILGTAAIPAGTVSSIATTSPITGGTITTTGTIGIVDAIADGATKGAASFVAADFDASSGNISLDYANGQAASGSAKGFLTSADWTTFNNKGVGTVTNVATGLGLSGGPITTTGTIIADTSYLVNKTGVQLLTNKFFTAPVLGTPLSVNLTNGTALPLTTGVTGVLPSANGGTGVNNGSSTITLSGNLVTTGSFNTTLATGFTGTITLPTATSTLATLALTETFTNKRITKRTGTTTSSATPTINTDNVDFYSITALSAAITSFTTNLSGTPNEAQTLWIAITDNGTARTLTFGASFEASTIPLPTTTVISTRMDLGFVWNTITSKWRLVAQS